MAFKIVTPVLLALIALISSVYSCTPAEQAACRLPNCLCPSINPPANLKPEEIPQIVYLTFDDAVSTINWEFYEEVILPRKNPNGAAISATFYITHQYNNYSMIHELYNKGHEIALHSVTHTADTSYWKNLDASMWAKEVAEQRGQVAHFAKINRSNVKGFRAPFLQGGGDTMMGVLYEEGLEYDCSRPTQAYMNPALWPYTAEYNQRFQDCQIEPCSVLKYPGFWIVPMVDYTGDNGQVCAMVDTCQPVPVTANDTFNLLKRNFDRHYNVNRAPFGVFTHAAWFANFPEDPNDRKAGYAQFLDYLATRPDVYIVSISKALDWLKTPKKLSELGTLASWAPKADIPSTCTTKSECHYKAEFTPFPGERYMPSCQTCPPYYPWLGNAYGLNPYTFWQQSSA